MTQTVAFAVEVEDVRVAYPGAQARREALVGVTLRCEPGRTLGLLGPNGSGKSTLFKVLATLLPPTSGSARIFGFDVVANRIDVRRRLGVVFQHPALDRVLTGRENLVCHGRLFGMEPTALGERTSMLLQAVGMADWADEVTKDLSGGMRRRLEIAKALVPGAPLLLMDEPTSGLDPAARRQVWELLGRMREAALFEGIAMTVVVATHLMDEAAFCDELVLLDGGRIVGAGTPSSLIERLGGDVVRLVPASPADVGRLAAILTEQLGEPGERVRLAADAVLVERPRGHELVTKVMTAGQTLDVLIREASVGRPTLEDVFLKLTGRGLTGA